MSALSSPPPFSQASDAVPDEIQAVFFDFDNTLIDFQQADIRALESLCRYTGAPDDPGIFAALAIEETFVFHHLVGKNEIDPAALHHYRLAKACEKLNIPWQDHYITFYKADFWSARPLTGVVDLLKKLRGRVKTGVITNAYDPVEQRERIHRCGLMPYFDAITIAAEIGVYKPDPAIFHFTLQKVNVSAANAIFIGDSIHHDIEGARAAGMKTVLISNTLKLSPADFTITDFAALEPLLDRLLQPPLAVREMPAIVCKDIRAFPDNEAGAGPESA